MNRMKSRKLELESLEDRNMPATGLTSHAPLAVPPTHPTIVMVASPQPMLALATNAGNVQADLSGKIATNHNETLVRDRFRRKHRRR
jgi:hypothetical protein